MIKYIKQEMSPLNSNGKQDCFYRTERHGNMTHDELVLQMSLGGMTKPRAEMALARLKESMTELLLLGYSVSIDGLGCFSLSLGTKDEKDVEEMDGDVRRNAASLKVRKVLFRTDRKWLNNLNLQCRFERGGVSRIQKESSCRGTASCQGTGVHCRTPHIAYCRICAYHGSFKEFGSKGTAFLCRCYKHYGHHFRRPRPFACICCRSAYDGGE